MLIFVDGDNKFFKLLAKDLDRILSQEIDKDYDISKSFKK